MNTKEKKEYILGVAKCHFIIFSLGLAISICLIGVSFISFKNTHIQDILLSIGSSEFCAIVLAYFLETINVRSLKEKSTHTIINLYEILEKKLQQYILRFNILFGVKTKNNNYSKNTFCDNIFNNLNKLYEYSPLPSDSRMSKLESFYNAEKQLANDLKTFLIMIDCLCETRPLHNAVVKFLSAREKFDVENTMINYITPSNNLVQNSVESFFELNLSFLIEKYDGNIVNDLKNHIITESNPIFYVAKLYTMLEEQKTSMIDLKEHIYKILVRKGFN